MLLVGIFPIEFTANRFRSASKDIVFIASIRQTTVRLREQLQLPTANCPLAKLEMGSN